MTEYPLNAAAILEVFNRFEVQSSADLRGNRRLAKDDRQFPTKRSTTNTKDPGEQPEVHLCVELRGLEPLASSMRKDLRTCCAI
jgi:hypothetical protein